MNKILLLPMVFQFAACTNSTISGQSHTSTSTVDSIRQLAFKEGTWAHFLQHLPARKGTVVDFTGQPVSDQFKQFAVIQYDVGKKDLQQCADAIMRLRAEFLFLQKRYNEIGFHFTSGHYYSWADYCAGRRPLVQGNKVSFVQSTLAPQTHQSLRQYLDIVYTYAGTISLTKELKDTEQFGVGTIIITPGSPGHACIIVDEGRTSNGEKVYKIAESYTPAQSIYILNNTEAERLGPWHQLKKEKITTASYQFNRFYLKAFE